MISFEFIIILYIYIYIYNTMDVYNQLYIYRSVHACSLSSAKDRSNIILGIPRSNHKEQDKFKDNIVKQQFG